VVATALSEYSGTQVNLLAQIPISVQLREGSDNGTPVVISNPEDSASIEIAKVAKLISVAKLPVTNRTLKVDIS